MRYWPRSSMTLAPWGTEHSPAAPAHRIRSPRTTLTAFDTGAWPVPSHRVAPRMAVAGLTGGGGTSLAGGAPQAAANRPTEPANAESVYVLMGSLLHLASCTERRPTAPQTARGRHKMRTTGSQGGDTEAVARRDAGHQWSIWARPMPGPCGA